MREMTFLETSRSFSMSNSAPEPLIFLVVNGKSFIGRSGFARRHSSKLEFKSVIRYSSTAGTG